MDESISIQKSHFESIPHKYFENNKLIICE